MAHVSIVIPHYGDPAPTLALIGQLASQEHPDLLEIIVCDDASPTALPEIEGVQIIRRELNGGFGRTVNSGALAASGDWLLILNSDLVVAADFVASMAEASTRFPCAVLSPRVVDEDGHTVWTGRNFPRIRHQAAEWLTPLARWRHTNAWHRAVGHDVRARDLDASVDWVVGAAMMIPLVAFQEVGGFDELFYMNCEEIDLQLRLRALGIPSIALSSPTVMHAGGGSSPSSDRRRWLVDGRLRFAEKWGGRRSLQAALIACSLTNLAANTARSLKDRRVHPYDVFVVEMNLLKTHRGR